MKIGVIGSRTITNINLENYIPEETTEIISGGAKGVDTLAREYAIKHDLKKTEYLPAYDLYGKSAPLKRNIEIINASDMIIAFWDEKSRGTKFVIDNCEKMGKKYKVIIYKP